MTPSRLKHTLIPALLLSLLASLPGCDAFQSHTPEEHIQRAKDFEDKNNLSGSIIELKNAIQKDPNNPQSRLLLGQIYLRLGQGAGAEKELRRAEQLGVKREIISASLGEALVRMGEYQRVLDEITVDAQSSKLNQARILQVRADAQFKLNKPREACETYRQSYAIDTSHPPTYWGLAQCAAYEGDLNLARSWLDKALALGSQQAGTWLYIGDWERLKGNTQAALKAYDNSLQFEPTQTQALHNRAILNLSLGNATQARKDAAKVSELLPKSVSALYLTALIDYENKQYTKAREKTQEILKQTESFLPAMLLAGASDFALGAYGQAESFLSRYIERVPRHSYARRLLATAQIKQKIPDRALQTLAPLALPDSKDAQALFLVSEALRLKEDNANASAFLQRALTLDPKNAGYQTQLGLSLLANGNPDLAMSELRKASLLNKRDDRADMAIIITLLNQRKYDQALAAIASLENKYGTSPQSLFFKGNVLIAKRDRTAARASFEQALKLDPRNFQATAGLSRLDLLDKKPAAAKSRFLKLLERDPANLDAMLALAGLAELNKQVPEYVDWLEKAAKAHPRAITPRVRLVDHLLAQKETQKALAIANELNNANPDNVAALEILGRVMLAMKDYEGAISAFSKITRHAESAPAAYVQLANIHLARNRIADARKNLAEALRARPGHEAALNALIRLEMKQNQPDAALALARQLQMAHPRSALGFEREGDIYLTLKKPDQATLAYGKALALLRGSGLFLKQHRAMMLSQDPAAEQSLKDWLSKYPEDNVVGFYAGEFYSARGRPKDAIAIYQELIRQNPTHSFALNNLAILYQSQGDKRALATAQKAYKIAPQHPAILDTLGWIMIEQGSAVRGLELVERALESDRDNPTMRYHRALGWSRTGQDARARTELLSLLKAHPSLPEAAAARTLLAKLGHAGN